MDSGNVKKRKELKEQRLKEKELGVFDDFRKEAEQEAGKKPKDYKTMSIIGLVLSILGFGFIFLFYPLAVILGVISLMISKSSIENGFKITGKISGIISFLDIFGFLIFAARMLSNLA